MDLVRLDEKHIARADLAHFTIVLDAPRPFENDNLVFVIVAVPRGVAARLDREMAHGEVRRSIIAPDHQAHLDALYTLHLDRASFHLFSASNVHTSNPVTKATIPAKFSREPTGEREDAPTADTHTQRPSMPDSPSLPVIHPFILGDFQTNCFVVEAPPNTDCWIVDCGQRPGDMLAFIEERNLRPVAILLTHTHMDHIAGVDEALTRFGNVPLYVHEAEAGCCRDPMLNLSGMIGLPMSVTEPTHHLHDGDVLTLGDTRWRVLHTPGHSPGGVCFIHDESHKAIVGDTLFAGGMGRIDFPTANPDDFRITLLQKMMSLPDEMVIHPGHGPSTTIGEERRTNPFLRGGW